MGVIVVWLLALSLNANAVAMKPADLTLRASPKQTRSRATMELILQVSADLLEEVGVEGFNTNLIAERAGVGNRAIYRYFPNKFAILVTMAERLQDLERAWVGDLRKLATFEDWRRAVDRAVDGYYVAAAQYRGYAALRAASQAVPQLRALDDRANGELENDLAAGLRELGVSLPPAHLQAVCRIVIEASNRILDISLQSPPPEAKLLVRELKRMIVNLVEDYVP